MKDVYQRRAKSLGHGGQIITTRWTILDFIRDIQCPVAYNSVYLISEGLYGREDYLRLYSVCSRLFYLSKLVYKGEDGVKKLGADQYWIKIFEPNAETREEIVYILKRMILSSNIGECFQNRNSKGSGAYSHRITRHTIIQKELRRILRILWKAFFEEETLCC
ncbi:MAG: hypothetical protein K6G88_04040 [Lachnospiraceae bacterium]|nr:hypothetical protein [Lachnospiraceae bacterium]